MSLNAGRLHQNVHTYKKLQKVFSVVSYNYIHLKSNTVVLTLDNSQHDWLECMKTKRQLNGNS